MGWEPDNEGTGHWEPENGPVSKLPPAFLDRFRAGEKWERAGKALVEGAKEGFGDAPVGIEPGSKREKELQDLGWITGPGEGQAGPLRVFNEALTRPTATILDTFMRSLNAGIVGSANVLKQLSEEAGASQGAANRNKNELTNLVLHRMIESGQSHASRVERGPDGKVHDVPVGGIPMEGDFKGAAEVATNGQATPQIEAKVRELWEQHGIHPAEVATDAQADPLIAQALASRNSDIPEHYTGADPKKPLQDQLKTVNEEMAKLTEKETKTPEDKEKITQLQEVQSHLEERIEGVEAGRMRDYPVGFPLEPGEVGAPDFPRVLGKRGGGKEPPKEPPGGIGGPDEQGRIGGAKGKSAADEAGDKLSAHMSIDETRQKPSYGIHQLYRDVVNEYWPIERAEAKSGLKLEPHESPSRLANLSLSWMGRTHEMLFGQGPRDFFTDKNLGPSFEKVLEPVKGEVKQFREFAAAARDFELEKRGIKTGFDREATDTVRKAWAQKYGTTFQEFVKYQNNVATNLRDAGFFTRPVFQSMLQDNRLFVPFHAVMDDVELGFTEVHKPGLENPIKRIEGSLRRKVDPIESAIKNTQLINAVVNKNVVHEAVVSMYERMESTKLVGESRELVPAEQPRGSAELRKHATDFLRENGVKDPDGPLADFVTHISEKLPEGVISLYRDGVKRYYTLPDVEVADALKHLDQTAANALVQFFGKITNIQRAGDVMTPDFWARHLYRDTGYAFVNNPGKGGHFTPVDTARGLMGMLRGIGEEKGFTVKADQDFHDFMYNGGGNTSMVAWDRDYFQDDLHKLTAQTGLMTRAQNVVLDPKSGFFDKTKAVLGVPFKAADRYVLRNLQLATEVSTSSTHLGAFKKDLRAREAERSATGTDVALRGATPGDLNKEPGTDVAGRYPTDMTPYESPVAEAMRINKPPGRDVALREGTEATEHTTPLGREGAGKRYDYSGKEIIEGEFTDIPTEYSERKKDVMAAASMSRRTAVDVARRGAQIRAYNMLNAFANAKIQDFDVIARSLINQPISTGLKLFGAITMPQLLLWGAQHNDSRYREMPAWQKMMFAPILTDKWEPATEMQALARKPDMRRDMGNGKWQVNNGTVWRLPVMFSAGVMFGSAPVALLDYYIGKNPDAFKGLGDALKESSAGSILPSALVPVFEQWTGRSTLTGHNLIPQSLEKGLPEYEYLPFTTELAKRTARVLGKVPTMTDLAIDPNKGVMSGVAHAVTSPILIEQYVRDLTGPLGMYALTGVDAALRKTGVLPNHVQPSATWADIPFVKAFVVRHPTANTQGVQDFYDMSERNAHYRASFQGRMKAGDVEAADRIREVGGAQIFAQVDGIKASMRVLSGVIQSVYQNDKDFSPSDKRQIIDTAYYRMIQLGEVGRSMLKHIEDAAKPPPYVPPRMNRP